MQLLLKLSRWSGPHAVFDGLAGSLTTPEKPAENVPLHKGPPQQFGVAWERLEAVQKFSFYFFFKLAESCLAVFWQLLGACWSCALKQFGVAWERVLNRFRNLVFI